MPGFVRAPSSATHPLDEIRAAIAWGRENGIVARPVAPFGVICASQHADVMACWERDERARGLNPIGLAILRCQPQTTDADEAAVLAVGAPLPWIEGFAEGVSKQEPSKAWVESIARVQFLQGYEAGLMTRAWLLRPAAAVVLPGEGIRS